MFGPTTGFRSEEKGMYKISKTPFAKRLPISTEKQ